ncbi:hypothetical protein GRJ2_000857800 [Grus japonensis]|uniref:Uncharacterized protein n=1 Tax=Grus japonensis TaxID=30415 RepID=A0ABC9WEI7_GRUJA
MENPNQSQSSRDPINNDRKVRPFELSGTTVGSDPVSPLSWDASRGRFHQDSKIICRQFHEVHRLPVDECWHINVVITANVNPDLEMASL